MRRFGPRRRGPIATATVLQETPDGVGLTGHSGATAGRTRSAPGPGDAHLLPDGRGGG